MGKKKNKKTDDDWEEDAAVIAEEERAAAEPGAALEALFADLILHEHASEADFDRATDELASGLKTEEALIAEWEAARKQPDDGQEASSSKKVNALHPAHTRLHCAPSTAICL